MATKAEIIAKITSNILNKTEADQITPAGVAEILNDILNLSDLTTIHQIDTPIQSQFSGLGGGVNFEFISGFNFLSPEKVLISQSIGVNDKILQVSLSYKSKTQGEILMVVQSIDDPVNSGRRALRILGIQDENREVNFSLSGSVEQFSNVSGILQTKSFDFDGSTPEILIDNIDPSTPFSAMRFVNTQESDLTCVNLDNQQDIETFGTSTIFSNTFTYSEYINSGNTIVSREGNYTTEVMQSYLVPQDKIALTESNEIIFDSNGLENFFLLSDPEKLLNVKIDYLETSAS